jgi:hypothetical protein
MLWVTLLISVGVLIAAAVGVVYWRRNQPKEEEVHYFRCPRCGVKLRYYSRQIGHRGMCNSCKVQFNFPTPVGASQTTSR